MNLSKIEVTQEIEAAIQRAMLQDTLAKAVAAISLWEHLRLCREIRDGIPVTSNFLYLVQRVIQEYIWVSPSDAKLFPDETTIHLPKMD